MKKKSFTLVEVLIAMVLMGILVGFLFKTHLETSLAASKLTYKKQILARDQRLYFRLSQIFSSKASVKKQEDQLILHYDGGLDRDPDFRGPLTSLLYYKDKNVYLATWPEKGDPRLELLWENAPDLTLLLVPEKNPTLVKITINKIEFPFFL